MWDENEKQMQKQQKQNVKTHQKKSKNMKGKATWENHPTMCRLEGSGVPYAPNSIHFLSVVPSCGEGILRSSVFATKCVGTAQGGQVNLGFRVQEAFNAWDLHWAKNFTAVLKTPHTQVSHNTVKQGVAPRETDVLRNQRNEKMKNLFSKIEIEIENEKKKRNIKIWKIWKWPKKWKMQKHGKEMQNSKNGKWMLETDRMKRMKNWNRYKTWVRNDMNMKRIERKKGTWKKVKEGTKNGKEKQETPEICLIWDFFLLWKIDFGSRQGAPTGAQKKREKVEKKRWERGGKRRRNEKIEKNMKIKGTRKELKNNARRNAEDETERKNWNRKRKKKENERPKTEKKSRTLDCCWTFFVVENGFSEPARWYLQPVSSCPTGAKKQKEKVEQN